MNTDTEQFTQFFKQGQDYTQFFKQGQDAVKQGQDAVRTTLENWTETVKAAVGQVPTLAPQFDAEAVVDQYYDLNEKVLGAQRDFAKRLLATGAAVAATAKV